LLKAFVATILKSIILITRIFKRKYLHCLRTARVTPAHRCSVYPYACSFVRSFVHLFASDEFVLRCSALMDGPCFRTFYRRLAHRYRAHSHRPNRNRRNQNWPKHWSSSVEFRWIVQFYWLSMVILSLNSFGLKTTYKSWKD